MAQTNVNLGSLKINVMGHDEYDNLASVTNEQLYIVKDANADTDNSISSRTYADVGRYAVAYGSEAPTNPLTKIWIDTSDDPVLISPASIDMDNLSQTGARNIHALLTPNFSAGSALSLTASGTYTLSKTGWIYITASASSEIKLLLTNTTGVVLTHIKTPASTVSSDKLFLKKSDKIYVDTLSGTVDVTFYPCKESI